MKDFILIISLLFSSLSIFSQEIVTDSVYSDSIYYEENDDYQDYYIDEEDKTNDGIIGLIGIEFRNQLLDKPDKFTYHPFGFYLGLYKQLNKSLPFFVGGGASLDFYGIESYEYFDYSFEDGYEYQYSDKFTGMLLNLNIGGKYFSKKSFWIFNPYVQLDLEYRYAFANVNTVNLDYDETVNSDVKKGNSGIGYDIGIGSLIYVNSDDDVFFNISLNYNSGGGLFLYNRRKGNYNVFSVLDYFDYRYFPIGFLTFKIGVCFI